MRQPLVLNGWTVTADSETFRIFPKNRKGDTIPITRMNQFLYLRGAASTIIVKRYLHRGLWYFRITGIDRHVYDLDVRDELSRLLFPMPNRCNGEGCRIGDRDRALDLMVQWISGKLPEPSAAESSSLAA